MKSNLIIPVGALIKVTTKDNKVLTNEQVKSIEIEPFFSTSQSQGELLQVETVLSDDSVVDRFTLMTSATSGKTIRKDRKDHASNRAVPAIEKKTRAAAEKKSDESKA